MSLLGSLLVQGDCLEVLKTLEANSIDSIVTDPPYGWRFMGKAWDAPDIKKHKDWAGKKEGSASAAGKYQQTLSANKAFQEWTEAWATEAFRLLKPGAHILVFCGPRTYHRMASGIEDAGFEIRDQIQWLFGSGFPKSHNIGDGRGTALKPANEPIVLARKPLEKDLTVSQNVVKWGCGTLNIDECRIETKPRKTGTINPHAISGKNVYGKDLRTNRQQIFDQKDQGRWPANIILDEQASFMLDEQSGILTSGKPGRRKEKWSGYAIGLKILDRETGFGDSGGASRFFYCAKSSKKERGNGNNHPTVKPIKLMEYLCKLITPPNGKMLDPFMGSGTTGIAAKNLGFEFVGIEMNKEYFEIAEKRIEAS